MSEAKHNVKMAPIMTVIAATNFIAMLNTIAIAIVLPVFMREFHTNIITVQWLVTGYMLANCIVAPTVGYIADRLGTKTTFLLAVVGFSVTTLLIGMVNSIQALIGIRVLEGLFGGMLMPLTQSMIYQVFPRQQQTKAISIWATTNLLAPTISPSLGGIIADLLGWRFIFFLQVPILVGAAIAAVFLIPNLPPVISKEDRKSNKSSFDYVGLVLSAIGSLSLLLSFSNISVWGLYNPKTIGLALIGFLTLAVFFRMEYHKEQPLLYARVFSYEGFISAIVLMCIGMMLTNTCNNILPIYLQNVMGLNTTQSALVMLPAPLVIMFVIPIMGKYYDVIGPRKMLFIIMCVGIVSCLLLGMMGPETPILFFIIALIIRDMGAGTTNMPATNMGMQVVPPQYATHAAAVMSWMKQCVVSLTIGLANNFVTARTAAWQEHYSDIADASLQYKMAYCAAMDEYFHIFIAVFIVGIIAIYFSRNRKKQNG